MNIINSFKKSLKNYNESYILEEYNYKEDEYKKIYDIHNTQIVKQKFDKENYTQITKVYNSKNIIKITDDDKYIRDIANEYLEIAGLEQNINYFMIEFWRYRLFGEKKSHKFDKHRDSFGALNDSVNACIFYLRKDRTFRGGDLEIYGKGSVFTTKLCKTIKPNDNILCFDGDIYHKVTDFDGFGIRDCVVIQFGKKDTVLNKIFN
jgi:hypothetical protein